ncbi:hypothetical protein RsoM2USA_102 [Ralstonia phage RsoM2USA]|nr:hypothetical protein RsoM2USA_102 [Ralstonia phage RsoM2USA]
MRIISKFQDYYDSGMAFGQDRSVVFYREEQDIIPVVQGYVKTYPAYMHIDSGDHYQTFNFGPYYDPDTVLIHKVTVVFCGRVWNALAVGHYKFQIFYDFDSFKEHLTKLGKSFENDSIVRWRAPQHEMHYKNWFADQGTTKHRDQLINDRIIIATNYRIDCYGDNQKVTTNGSLKEVQFYKVMDSYTAFQEIDMWIGGVLPKDGPPMIEVTDKDKVAKHGFDKHSFRKSPTKKR